MTDIILNVELPAVTRPREMNSSRKLALANGDRFYQGTSCKKGNHDGVRWTVDGHCRDCKAAMRKQEKTLAAIRRGSRKHELKKFGMIEADYTKLLEKQNYVCAICKKPETVKLKSGQVKCLAVDHCHDKGHVRGLLCYACNVGIGLLKHDAARLRAAALYCEGT